MYNSHSGLRMPPQDMDHAGRGQAMAQGIEFPASRFGVPQVPASCFDMFCHVLTGVPHRPIGETTGGRM